MTAREICRQFANKHKLVFEDAGECGFGRPCVGFIKGESYVAHNPYNSGGDYEPIEEFKDDRLYAPEGVHAYHKHDCLAVLAHGEPPDYESAIEGLAKWVKHLESLGDVEVVQYRTGATGFQAILTGVFGYTVKVSQNITPNE